MKLKVKINLINERGEGFMGAGLLELLGKIDQTGSIHRAAGEMSLSYAKALKILNRLEENLGGRVLERSRGGRERGGARLTEFGKRLVREYGALQDRLTGYGESRFPHFLRRIEAGRRK